MAVIYRYIRKDNNEVVYVGITGTKGRVDGIDAVCVRDKEHFTKDEDPLWKAGVNPDELWLDYCDGFSDCDALALETLAIGFYKPKYNTSKNNLGGSELYSDLAENVLVFNRVDESLRAKRGEHKISKQANGKKSGIVLTDRQIERLESTVKSKAILDTPERDWCIIALFIFTGIRLRDVVQMELDDFGDSSIYLRRTNERLRICPRLKDALQRWIDIRKEIKPQDGNPMFLSNQNRRISPKTIEWFISLYGKEAGIENCIAASLICTYRKLIKHILFAKTV